MKKRIYHIAAGLISLAFLISAGCSGNYGRLLAGGYADQVSVAQLMDNWTSYDVYYAGVRVKTPSAVLFDPKNDNLQIMPHEAWVPVKDKETLRELIHWLDAEILFPPRLYDMVGPRDRLFGYMYTAWNYAHMKVVDENTLWVDDIPLPPLDYGPGKVTSLGR